MTENKSILIVDDEINLRRTLAYILQNAGYEVNIASDGISALQILKTKSIDLVIVDLQLPDIEGIRLTKQLHEIVKNLPVVILTAHPASEAKEIVKNNGIAAYLVKPIDPDIILKTIKEVLASPDHPI